jgi:hypothetical protein
VILITVKAAQAEDKAKRGCRPDALLTATVAAASSAAESPAVATLAEGF